MASRRYADAVTLDQLEIFVEVVEAGSFTRAAERLRRAQSVVSYGVTRLELQLGLKLLDRSLAGARPTPQGRILLAEAREVISHADRLRAAGLALSKKVEPEVSISVSGLDQRASKAPAARRDGHERDGRQDLVNVLSPRTWRIADTMVRYEMTLAGVGWTHFTRAWVAGDIESGALVELRFGKNELAPQYTPRIFYRTDAPPGPAGRWLIDRICEAPSAPARPPSKKARR